MNQHFFKFVALALFLLLNLNMNGQNYDLVVDDYGDSHDSNVTSERNIRIPLYSIETDYVSIPIYLTYNTKGVLVNEVPSSIGYGWKLKAGGQITRQINHIADESYNKGWFFDDAVLVLNHQLDSHVGRSLTGGYGNFYRNHDIAPDIFSMNISNGDHISYFYEKKEVYPIIPTPYTIKENNDFFEPLTNFNRLKNYNYTYYESDSLPYFNEYDHDIRLKKKDGTTYLFRKGVRRMIPFDLERDGSFQIDSSNIQNFYLHKVTSDLNKQEIDFEYIETKLKKIIPHSTATRAQPPPVFPGDDPQIKTSYFYKDLSIEDVSRLEIKKITSDKKIIEFVYKEDNYHNSVDGYNTNGAYCFPEIENQKINLLDEINIYDHQHNYITGYKFIYTEESQDEVIWPLKLKLIFKYGRNKKKSTLFKKFVYYDELTGKPHATSMAQDVFGYRNGASQNNQMYYYNIFPSKGNGRLTLPFSHLFQNVPMANKMPNEAEMKKGMLKSIVNKTGGKQEFIYKENSYGEVYYGGLLMVGYKIFDINNSLISQLNYEYFDPEGFGLPMFAEHFSGQGTPPSNTYEEGYWQDIYSLYPWQTYFTKRDPLNLNDPILSHYNVRNTPFDLMANYSPETNSLLNQNQLSNYQQQTTGHFYRTIIEKKIDVNSGVNNSGYIKYNYRASLAGFQLSKKLASKEYFNSSNTKVKEIKYSYRYLYPGNDRYINFNKWESVHGGSYNYIIETFPLYFADERLESIETKYYNNTISTKSYKNHIEYLSDILTDAHNSRKIKLIRKYYNGTLVEKIQNKYLSEYDNVGQIEMYLLGKNPLVEKSVWNIKNGTPIHKYSIIKRHDMYGNIEEVINDNGRNQYVPAYFNSSHNLIHEGKSVFELFYDSSRRLTKKIDHKQNLVENYQRSNEYGNLYIDAVLITPLNNNDSIFLKKSFENMTGDGVIKFDKAFSGNYVFDASIYSLFLGSFPTSYEVSYWEYRNNKWQYRSFVHNGGSLVIWSPTMGYIDEVRVQPPNSRILSRTYKPLIGPTSVLDNRGKGVKTEYDLFNRPLFILDEQNNVLKEYRHNYILNSVN